MNFLYRFRETALDRIEFIVFNSQTNNVQFLSSEKVVKDKNGKGQFAMGNETGVSNILCMQMRSIANKDFVWFGRRYGYTVWVLNKHQRNKKKEDWIWETIKGWGRLNCFHHLIVKDGGNGKANVLVVAVGKMLQPPTEVWAIESRLQGVHYLERLRGLFEPEAFQKLDRLIWNCREIPEQGGRREPDVSMSPRKIEFETASGIVVQASFKEFS